MIYSMTGYGRGEARAEGRLLRIELRSVNSRYCEINTHLPRVFLPLEASLRQLISRQLQRGKIEVYCQYEDNTEASQAIHLNRPLAEAYRDAVEQLGQHLRRPYQFRMQDLLCSGEFFQHFLSVEARPLEEEAWLPLLQTATDQALAQLQASRHQEGLHLQAAIMEHLQAFKATQTLLVAHLPTLLPAYRSRLEARLRQYLGDTHLPEERILLEVALLADRNDVAEELARIDSHLNLLRQTLEGSGPMGKKLDFILQELNREVNTLGSKSSDAQVAEWIVDLKSQLEKIREQVQNLE